MKRPEPLYRDIKCPCCNYKSNIVFKDSGAFWLDGYWQCPWCHKISTTTQIHQYSSSKESNT